MSKDSVIFEGPRRNFSFRKPIQRHFEKKFKNPSYERRYSQKQSIKRLKKESKRVRKGRNY